MRLMTWRAVSVKAVARGRIRETRRAASEAQLAYQRCSDDLMVGTHGWCSPHHRMAFKLSVGRTCPVYLLDIEGLLTQGSRPGRTVGESVGGIF